MAESHILISLFQDLKRKIDSLDSKNAMMDAKGIQGMRDIVKSCNNMDRYIDSFVYKEQYVVNVAPAYEMSCLNMTSIPNGHVGPTMAMRRFAAKEERDLMDRVDRTIQMGKDLEANKDKPYFTIQ